MIANAPFAGPELNCAAHDTHQNLNCAIIHADWNSYTQNPLRFRQDVADRLSRVLFDQLPCLEPPGNRKHTLLSMPAAVGMKHKFYLLIGII